MRKRAVAVAALTTLLLSTLLVAFATPASALPTPNTLRVSGSSSSTFVNGYFSFSWEIKLNASTPTGAIGDTALYIDNRSHGPSGFEYWMYTSRVSGSTTDGRNFTASIHAPAAPDRLYVIAMANVSGMTVYNTTEWVVDVFDEPKVTLVAPGLFMPGEAVLVQLKVEWGGTQPLQLVTAHYDSNSHASNINTTAYPNATTPQAGSGRSFNLSVNVPSTDGTLYLIGRVRAGGRDFYTTKEYAVPVTSGPHVSQVSFSPAGVVLTGQLVNVTFKVDFSGGAVTGFFRFDTASHVAEGANSSLYPRASTSMSAAGGNFSVSFNAPDEAGNFYGVVTLLTSGRVYTGTEERSLPVLARPTIALVDPPNQLNTGQTQRITWRITFTGDASLIQSSDLLWSTGPIGGNPSSAAHVEHGVFDAGSGTWSASIPAQGAEGTLYVAVRATVNGMVLYMSPESTLTVGKGPSGFLPGPEAFLIAGALLAATAVAGSSRTRTRRKSH